MGFVEMVEMVDGFCTYFVYIPVVTLDTHCISPLMETDADHLNPPHLLSLICCQRNPKKGKEVYVTFLSGEIG